MGVAWEWHGRGRGRYVWLGLHQDTLLDNPLLSTPSDGSAG